MLRAIPKHWYSWDFVVADGEQTVAEIDVSSWSEKGVLSIEGDSYKVYRQNLISGPFVLEFHGSVLASAEKPSALSRTFLIKHRDTHYTMRAESVFRRSFLLSDSSSRELGSLRPDGVFTRRASVELPEDFPVALKVFIVWLAVIMWKRGASASAS